MKVSTLHVSTFKKQELIITGHRTVENAFVMLTKLMIARETSQPWQWVSLEFNRDRRVTFIACDSSLKLKLRQGGMSQNISLLTELGSGLSTVYKRDAPTALQAPIKLTDYATASA